MLPPEEWKRLHEEEKAWKREIKRLTSGGIDSGLVAQFELANMERVQRVIKQHNDGSDPWAPLGGLDPRTNAMGFGAIWDARRDFLKSQRRRERWLYFSLVSNAQLCLGAAWVIQYMLWWCFARKTATHISLSLYAGATALLLVAAVVLRFERRARSRFYEAQRAGVACSQAATPAVEATSAAEARVPTTQEPASQAVLSVSRGDR